MSAFLFALVVVFLTSLGSRDQVLIARLSQRLGRSNGLIVIGCVVASATAGAMAWGGHYIAEMLPSAGKTMLIAFALIMAAIELIWPNKTVPLKEPTRSLGAIAMVLLVRQFGDASRFTIFAFAAAAGTPVFAGIGGAVGGIAAVTLGWMLREELIERLPLRAIRIVLGCAIGAAAIVVGLFARGLIF